MSGARNASDRVIRIERSIWPSRKASDSKAQVDRTEVRRAGDGMDRWVRCQALVICNGSFDGSLCRFHPRPRTAALGLRVHPRLLGLKTLSLRPSDGPFHLPFNHRSPWRALMGVAARAPWRRRPLHRSGMGGAVGPVKIRTRPYSLSKGSGRRATTRPAQPSGLLVCPNFSGITPVRFSAFRLPGISRKW
jgi:hypothetical protein